MPNIHDHVDTTHLIHELHTVCKKTARLLADDSR